MIFPKSFNGLSGNSFCINNLTCVRYKPNQIANLSFRWNIATRRVVEGSAEKISKYREI